LTHPDPKHCANSKIPEYRKALILLATLRALGMRENLNWATTNVTDIRASMFVPNYTTAGAMLNLVWPAGSCCHECVGDFEHELEAIVRQLIDHLEAVATARSKKRAIRYWTRLLDRLL
jgi:hypothetical protein